MGKLKLQIAAILLSLFLVAMFCLAYLNLSLLTSTVENLVRRESGAQTAQLAEFLKTLSISDYRLDLGPKGEKRRELMRFLGALPGLENLEIYDSALKPLYRYRPLFVSCPEDLLQKAQAEKAQMQTFFRLTSAGGYQPIENLNRRVEGSVYCDTILPLEQEGKPIFLLRLTLDESRLPRLLNLTMAGNLMLALIFLITAFLAVSLWAENALSRPLRSLVEAQEKLGKGDFSARLALPINPANELSQVAGSFNQMVSELGSSQEQLREKTSRLSALNLEYQQLNQQLEEKVETKTREMKEFFSIITHDLKVPLAAIRGYSDLLLKEGEEPLAGKKRQFVKAVSLAAVNSLDLLNNMLEVMRLETGRFACEPEEFDLSQAVQEMEQHFRPAFEEKGVEFFRRIPPQTEKVIGDRAKIFQVLLNLTNNALHHTSGGGKIELVSRLCGDKVEVTVRDSGSGIPEEFLPRIFEKFFGRTEGGTGLGLYIVKKILEAHGETIQARNLPEGGAEFVFTLASGEEGN